MYLGIKDTGNMKSINCFVPFRMATYFLYNWETLFRHRRDIQLTAV